MQRGALSSTELRVGGGSDTTSKNWRGLLALEMALRTRAAGGYPASFQADQRGEDTSTIRTYDLQLERSESNDTDQPTPCLCWLTDQVVDGNALNMQLAYRVSRWDVEQKQRYDQTTASIASSVQLRSNREATRRASRFAALGRRVTQTRDTGEQRSARRRS
jgi:hypothetical protein